MLCVDEDGLLRDAPGLHPELAPLREGTALGSASEFVLWGPKQGAGPLGRGVVRNPIPRVWPPPSSTHYYSICFCLAAGLPCQKMVLIDFPTLAGA
jgi:hypothetical protein